MLKRAILLTLVLVITSSYMAHAQDISVAVLEFKESGLVDLPYWFRQELLHGISQMIASELVKEPGITVLERDRIQAVLAEQRLQRSGAVDRDTAIKLGKLIGADVIIMGTLNELGMKNGAGLNLGRIKLNTSTAKVRISGRLIAVETSEVLASVDARGENTGAQVSVRNLQGLSFGTKEFNDSIVGKALNSAITDFVNEVRVALDKIDDKLFTEGELETGGYVVGSRGDYIIVDLGAMDGIKEGMSLRVYKIDYVEGLSDPIRIPVGMLKVISVDDHACVTSIEESVEPVDIGDIAEVY